MAILVAIAAARDIVSEGLRSILAADGDIDVLDRFPHVGVRPDVVLYDAVGITADGGNELCGLAQHPEWRVIVIARDLRPGLAARARALGAYGSVSLEADACELRAIIHEAAASPAGQRGPWHTSDGALGAHVHLRPREVQILDGITRGLTNAEICDRLGLGVNTVKTYVRSAYRKMGVTTRAQAVAWCLQHGFDPPD